MTTTTETAAWMPRIIDSLPYEFDRGLASQAKFADQFASLDANGHTVLAGDSTRSSDGLLHIYIPPVSDEERARQCEQATADREASARRAMKAAGLTAPEPPSPPVKKVAPSSTSATVPVAERATPRRRRGPSNAGDFPFAQRRFREAQHRLARVRGDYLDTGHEPLVRTPAVKLRPATAARVKVSFGARAWCDITRLVQVADGDHEVGGCLLGYETESVLRVIHALPPGEHAEATKCSIRTAQEQALIDQLIAEAPGDMRELGGWHSHPYGNGEPSKSDISNMVADHEVMNIAKPLEVIVRPSAGSGWAKPIPVAWILTASDDPAYRFDVKLADLA